MLDLKLNTTLAQLHHQALSRSLLPIEGNDGIYSTLANKKYLSFSTNNYLGLTHHPKVIKAAQKALGQFGVGSGSASLITGYTSLHQELEEKMAHFLQYPKVLLFSSGYAVNAGIISALFSKQDVILADKLNHASLVDGCLAAKSYFKRYQHRRIEQLEELCQLKSTQNKLIVSEGLFGMEGTLAPLDKIAALACRTRSMVLIDDAHGIGVLGEKGRGTLEYYNLGHTQIPLLTGTFGKAFGTYGAFVASSQLIIESLLQLTQTYLYTTALPPALAAASIASLQIIQQEPWRRQKIQALISYFKECAQQLDIPTQCSNTPIQSIILGSSRKATAISQQLFNEGILLKAIRPPTVPKATARLRVTITYEHTKSHIDYLLESLANALKKG